MNMPKSGVKEGPLVQISSLLLILSPMVYSVWLLLPAVQNAGRAVTGVCAVMLFALGALLDVEHLKKHWGDLLLRALCTAVLPIVLIALVGRGTMEQPLAYYVQFLMFFYPLTYCGYARQKGDARLWRYLKWVILACVCLTVATTIGWLIQGILRSRTEGRIFAYSRSLGYAGNVDPAYLKELMGRNIGGYDFIYAAVAALPLCCVAALEKPKYRLRFALLAALMTVMIVLSQYTYAMIYAGAFWAVLGVAGILRKISRKKISFGASLLWGVLPFALLLIFAFPLTQLAVHVCSGLGMTSLAHSFELLRSALNGAMDEGSRLAYYLKAWQGFTQSPLVGSIFSGNHQLSLHSDLLDLLSGLGLVGTAAFAALLYGAGHGALKGLGQSPRRVWLRLSLVLVGITAALGTVVYSREISAVVCFGALAILEADAPAGEEC